MKKTVTITTALLLSSLLSPHIFGMDTGTGAPGADLLQAVRNENPERVMNFFDPQAEKLSGEKLQEKYARQRVFVVPSAGQDAPRGEKLREVRKLYREGDKVIFCKKTPDGEVFGDVVDNIAIRGEKNFIDPETLKLKHYMAQPLPKTKALIELYTPEDIYTDADDEERESLLKQAQEKFFRRDEIDLDKFARVNGFTAGYELIDIKCVDKKCEEILSPLKCVRVANRASAKAAGDTVKEGSVMITQGPQVILDAHCRYPDALIISCDFKPKGTGAFNEYLHDFTEEEKIFLHLAKEGNLVFAQERQV